MSGNARLDILKLLNESGPNVGLGASFDQVSAIELTFQGAAVEYIDAIALTYFYNNLMTPVCKEYLEHVAFFVQNLSIQKMTFKFYDKEENKFDLTLGKLGDLLDISGDLEWEVVNQTELVIKSKRFIGYQLSRLKAEDRGMALYRAARVEDDRFVFETVSLFKARPNTNIEKTDIVFVQDSADVVGPNIMKILDNDDYIDNYSTYSY